MFGAVRKWFGQVFPSRDDRDRGRMKRLWRMYQRGEPLPPKSIKASDAGDFPAIVGRLRLEPALRAVAKGEGKKLPQILAPLIRQGDQTNDDWQRHAAQTIAEVIDQALALAGENATALDEALAAYQVFRSESTYQLPQAFDLIAALARRPALDDRAVRGYIEYLRCRPVRKPTAEDRAVEQALQEACDPDEDDAEVRNQLVKDVCGERWATLNLMQVHRRKGDLEAARKQLDEAATPTGFGEPRWDFEAGLVHRGRREWGQAAECFTRAAEGLEDAHQRLAEVYALEASFHDESARLHTLSDAAAIDTRWRRWRTQVERACQAGVPAALPLLLALDQRLDEPRTVWAHVGRFGDVAQPSRELQQAVKDLMLDSESDLADDLFGPVTARPMFAHVQHARRLLTRGQIRLFETYQSAIVGDQPRQLAADSAPVRLLQAELMIRTGQGKSVPADWLIDDATRADFPALAVRLRMEQALIDDPATAAALLASPESLHLNWILRQVYLGESVVATDWHRGWQLLSRAAEADPDFSPVQVACGLAALLLGQDGVGGACFSHLAAIQPDNHYAMIGTALARGRLAVIAPKLLADEPRAGELALPWARRLARGGRHDLAAELHQHLIEKGQSSHA